MPAHDSGECEVLDQLAEEFAARYRRGERPTLKEYLDRYPELADDIRALFPALVEMEEVKDDRAAHAAGTERPPLQQVGDYRILREVGRGGMGVVYEAVQLSLGRRVALKVLPAHVAADGQALERFRREARSAAKLHHTNIVPVFEVGQVGDTCYYAMQFIQRQSLDQVIGELRRLRGNPAAAEEHPPAGGADGPRPGADRLAHSLLTGRFRTDRAPAEAGAATAWDEGPGPALAVAERPAPCVTDPAPSAVLPGQTEL